jgi:hypothetical protein
MESLSPNPDATKPPCCPATEPEPCKLCIGASGPADALDGLLDDVNAELLAGVREVEAHRAPTLSLAELVDRQADAFRAWPIDAGRMIAEALDELAMKIRMTGATTPAEFDARVEVVNRDLRETWEAVGYDRAMSDSGEAPGPAFGHMA